MSDATPEPDADKPDPAEVAILELTAGEKHGVRPEAVARHLAEHYRKPKDGPDLWRKYMTAVRQEALHLARRGDIVILRKGKPIDPHKPFKGLVKYARPGTKPATADPDSD